jgi:hypothetical protein
MTARQWILKEPAAIFFIPRLLNHGHHTVVITVLAGVTSTLLKALLIATNTNLLHRRKTENT